LAAIFDAILDFQVTWLPNDTFCGLNEFLDP